MNISTPIPKGLLDELDKLFPEQSPDLRWSDREVWAKAGERRVVRALWAAFQKQNQPLSNDHNGR